MPQIGKDYILWDKDDMLSGIDMTTAAFTLANGKKLAKASQFDPLRTFGYGSPGFLPTDVTNIAQVTSYLRNGVVKDTFAYCISGGNMVHKIATVSGAVTNAGTFPHTIIHGAHTNILGNDICNYYTYNAGTPKLCAFYSFNDDTDWDVGIYDYALDSFDDDFMSTIPTTPLASPYLAGGAGYPHPLIVGDDDILYMGDRNFVHAYDLNTGVFSAAVLTLSRGTIITSFCKTKDLRLAIASYSSISSSGSDGYTKGAAMVWFWNYLAQDPDYARDLHDNYVSEVFTWNGTIAAFTTGGRSGEDAGAYKLQALKGSEFEVIQIYYQGGLPIRGGVDIVKTDIYWNANGAIMGYTKRADNGSYIINNFYGTGVTTAGMLKFFTASFQILFSDGNGVGAGLRAFGGNYIDSATITFPAVTIPFPNDKMGRITKVAIKFAAPTSGGRSINLQTTIDTNFYTTIDTFTTVPVSRVYVTKTQSDGSPLGDFYTIQPVLTWGTGLGSTSAPRVEYVKYEFELTNTH